MERIRKTVETRLIKASISIIYRIFILLAKKLTKNLPMIIKIQKIESMYPAPCTSIKPFILKKVGDQFEIINSAITYNKMQKDIITLESMISKYQWILIPENSMSLVKANAGLYIKQKRGCLISHFKALKMDNLGLSPSIKLQVSKPIDSSKLIFFTLTKNNIAIQAKYISENKIIFFSDLSVGFNSEKIEKKFKINFFNIEIII